MAQARLGSELRPGNWRIAMWAVIALVLLAPLVAMQFTREVLWTPGDFVVGGLLLVGGGAAYEVAVRAVRNRIMLTAIAVVIVVLVGLIWVQGAVGIF